MNLNELSQRVHQQHIKWWQDPRTGAPVQRNLNELLMLVITELAEMTEGVRKDLMDDHLPHRKMEEVEAADAVIRLLDMAGGLNAKLHMAPSHYLIPDNKAAAIFSITRSVALISEFEAEAGCFIGNAIKHIQDYCIRFNLDLWGAVEEKLDYNLKRQDHTHEARLASGGKKF